MQLNVTKHTYAFLFRVQVEGRCKQEHPTSGSSKTTLLLGPARNYLTMHFLLLSVALDFYRDTVHSSSLAQ